MRKYTLLMVMLLIIFLFGCSSKRTYLTTNDANTSTECSIKTTSISKKVESIEMYSLGETYYYSNENFSCDGFSIAILYDDDTSEVVPLTSSLFIIKNSELKTTHYITVEYASKKTSFKVTYGNTIEDWYEEQESPKVNAYGKSKTQFILYLTNEESLLNKSYTIDDFSSLGCTDLVELTIKRHKNIALETNDQNFRRKFLVTIDSNNKYVEDAIESASEMSIIDHANYMYMSERTDIVDRNPVNIDYMSRSFVVTLMNKESLKGINYSVDFFKNLGCVQLIELTKESNMEEAIAKNDRGFQRIFQIVVGEDDISNIQYYIDIANNLTYVDYAIDVNN